MMNQHWVCKMVFPLSWWNIWVVEGWYYCICWSQFKPLVAEPVSCLFDSAATLSELKMTMDGWSDLCSSSNKVWGSIICPKLKYQCLPYFQRTSFSTFLNIEHSLAYFITYSEESTLQILSITHNELNYECMAYCLTQLESIDNWTALIVQVLWQLWRISMKT